MSKILTLLFAVLLSTCCWAATPTVAEHAPTFNDDLHCLNEAFQGLTTLEQLLESRNATHSELAAEQNELLQYLAADQQDMAQSLLAAVAPMDPALKAVLIVFGILAVLAIGCCVLYIAVWNSVWWGW